MRPMTAILIVLLLLGASVIAAWSGAVYTSTFFDDVITSQDEWSQLMSHLYGLLAIAMVWAASRRLPAGWRDRRMVIITLVALTLILPRYAGSQALKELDARNTIRDTFDPLPIELLPTATVPR